MFSFGQQAYCSTLVFLKARLRELSNLTYYQVLVLDI